MSSEEVRQFAQQFRRTGESSNIAIADVKDPDVAMPQERGAPSLAAQWEQVRHAVFAQLLAGIGSFHDAEDVLQEVAVSIAKNYNSYDPTRPFVAWALGIARNHMLMHFRKNRRNRLVFSEEMMNIVGHHLEALTEEQADIRREALHKCLRKLDPDRRRLVDMRYSGGMTIREISARAGQSVAAVKGSLHRARKALEKCIQVRTGRAYL